MILRTLSGEQIDTVLTCAMEATIHALVDEGFLDTKIAQQYAASHVCLSVNDNQIWQRIRNWIGLEKSETLSQPVIFKVVTKQVDKND